MTDHKEEQQNELEALESIYPDELNILTTSPLAVFEISLKSQKNEDDEDEDEASCTVKFTYTATYPDEAPVIEITESDNLEEDQLLELLNIMTTTAEENLGMAMVFTLVSAIQEELTTLVEQTKERRAQEVERRLKEEEELEHKKFEGIRVTIENFLAWKTKFEAEMVEMKKIKKSTDANKKLTGKELFMKDSSMIESDVQFLQDERENGIYMYMDNLGVEDEEGENVEVDESLFQDMDDLDIGDDVDLDLDIED